jgi:signal transduction histidine kinase
MKDKRTEGKYIFVVDDDPSVLALIQTILGRAGLKIKQFLNSENMLDMARHHLRDLILLDIDMPSGLDGFETMVDPVYINSSDGIVEYMNPAMICRIGENAIGKICYSVLHGFDKPCECCVFDKIQDVQAVENQFISPRDNRRFQVTNIPIHHENGTLSKMTIMKDVTEYWNALEANKKSEALLQQSQKLKSIGQLAAGIVHEINTPIQYINDNINYLETAFSDLIPVVEFVQEFVDSAKNKKISEEMIKKVEAALENTDLDYHRDEIPLAMQQSADGAEQIATIVQSMKEFSHPSKDMVLTDINRALENTITISRNEWKDVSDLTCDFDPSLPHIRCSLSEINQVFLNLIINASHAIKEVVGSGTNNKGHIHIQTRKKDNWVQISIKDTGTGISTENQRQIFDPFFTTRKIGEGIGQGLFISYSTIVENLNGKIECDSKLGNGSIFFITLPIEKESRY